MDEAEIPQHLRYTLKLLASSSYGKRVNIPAALKGKEEAELVASHLRDSTSVTAFTMALNEAGTEECEPLFAALAEKHSLRHLDLRGNWLGDRQAPAIAAIIESNPYIGHFSVADTGMTAKGAAIIAQALEGRDELYSVSLSTNALGDEGAKHLAKLLETCPALSELRAEDADIGDEGLLAITAALTDKTELTALHLGNNLCSQQANDALAAALLANGSPNFIETGMPRPDARVTELCVSNRKLLDQAEGTLEELYRHVENRYGDVEVENELDSLVAAEIALIRPRISALRHRGNVDEALEEVESMLEDMPVLPEDAPPTLEALTAKGKYGGWCPLDNPLTWEQMPEIATALAAAGTPLTHELLAGKSGTGESFLTVGLAYAPDATIESLNLSGLRIGHAELIDSENRMPTRLCKYLTKQGAMGSVFAESNWPAETLPEMRATYNALPDDAKEQVGGFHALAATLAQKAQPQERGR